VFHSEQSNTSKQEEMDALALYGEPLKAGLDKWKQKKEWQSKVYQKEKVNYDEQKLFKQYHEVSKEVFKRDHGVCQSCLIGKVKLERKSKYLTCHHINPRLEGGSLILHNLITLCNTCHDIVEEKTFRSQTEICGLMAEDKRHWHRESSYGVKWQEWVYGGKKRPK